MDRDRADRFAQTSHTIAGWASLGFGLLLLAKPSVGSAVGLGEDRRLVRAAGAVDLTLGIGLLRGQHAAHWMLGRLVGNAVIGALCVRVIAAGGARRGRTIGLLATLAGLSVTDGLAAWHLR